MPGIYIHIPFCKRRCIYCDFFSSTHSDLIDNYVDALCKELELRKDYLAHAPINTIYFGGGTPSQLSRENLEQIFSYIYKTYKIDSEPEITLEANPDDLSPEYIRMLHSLPINRLSIGVQTFNEECLQLLQRRHSAQQAIEAINNCRNIGFNNISIDLIYGLPEETLSEWVYDLTKAISLNVQHISAYHLIYEEGTPLWKMQQKQQIKEIDEDSSLTFFSTLINQLTQAGFTHYEISNFCQSELYSRHNSSYWKGEKYLGCGASAHSYNGISRQWNISSLNDYIKGVKANNPVFEIENLDLNTRYNDYIITSLRTMWGLSLSKLRAEFGDKLYNYCLHMAAPYIKQKKLKTESDILRLTPEGIFISDGIMSDLLWVE